MKMYIQQRDGLKLIGGGGKSNQQHGSDGAGIGCRRSAA